MQKRGKIQISEHAKMRLSERVKDVRSCDYNGFVNTARYSGLTLHDLSIARPRIATYIKKISRLITRHKLGFIKVACFCLVVIKERHALW